MRLSVALAVAMLAAGALAAPSAGLPGQRRVRVGADVSVRVPGGWHVIGWHLTRVVSPVQRLVVTSFPVARRRPVDGCDPLAALGRLPASGAYLFMWEYTGATRLSRRQLMGFPPRRGPFRLTYTPYGGGGGPWMTTVLFRDQDRAFQAQLYLGRRATARTRRLLAQVLDGLTVGALPASGSARR